jgi:hypothetical protein
MATHGTPLRRRLAVACTTTFLALAGLGVGCSDDTSVNSTPASYYGTYGDTSGAAGTISLSPAAAAAGMSPLGLCSEAVSIAGELRIGGLAPISLAGFYCPHNGSISFVSEDDAYEFTGTVVGAQAAGTVFGPSGNGTFVLFVGGTSADVATFCTTATCTSPVSCQMGGAFNIAVSGSAAMLSGYYNGLAGYGAGTAAGSTVDVHMQNVGLDVTIHGTIDGTAISGTWTDNTNTVSGTWGGSTAQCLAAAPIRR